jgi:hypothetical protein
LEPPTYPPTDHRNHLLALFHLNQGDCKIVPSNHIMNYKRCKMDIDRELLFLKIQCASVMEARKRALVMAFMTYEITNHIFVKLNTGEMLENPYDLQNIYHVKAQYDLEEYDDGIDVKHNVMR